VDPVVAPSREDPVVRAGSEVLGGPLGARARLGAARFWTPLAVLLLLTTAAMLLGVVAKQHCRAQGWSTPDQFFHLCYSDVPSLFGARGLATGTVPYVSDVPAEQMVEYPVLTGAVMWATALLTPGEGYTSERVLWYFDINLVLTSLCALGVVAATASTSRRRPWDAALVALSPGLVLTATINWDLYAVLLTAVAMLLWARERPVMAGVFLGLATAAKFYPLLLLGPLFLLCLRAGRLRAWAGLLAAAVLAWLAVNLPVLLAAPDGWARFYQLSRERGAGFSSVWFVLAQQGAGLSDPVLNVVALLAFLLCCLAIGWLAVAAPRRPRVASLAFLVVAAFLLTNKVYSPQYVLWLVPLAALARPRWRDVLVWQAGEAVHFVGIWLLLAGYTPEVANRALPADGYGVTVLAHVAGTSWLMAMVVRDVWSPRHDPVRADGSDDPAGGVLDGAPDSRVLDGLRLRRPAAPVPAVPSDAAAPAGAVA
jgi:uncharacterized membrane protein